MQEILYYLTLSSGYHRVLIHSGYIWIIIHWHEFLFKERATSFCLSCRSMLFWHILMKCFINLVLRLWRFSSSTAQHYCYSSVIRKCVGVSSCYLTPNENPYNLFSGKRNPRSIIVRSELAKMGTHEVGYPLSGLFWMDFVSFLFHFLFFLPVTLYV